MKRKILLGILILACAAGLALNVFTVITRERALAEESVWRFRIEGFDPLDPFRGRYIEFRVPELLALEAFEDGEYPAFLDDGDTFYALLERDGDGFGRISNPTDEKPDGDGNWLKLRYLGSGAIEPVFTRYYVSEPDADELDRRFSAARGDAYVTVRIADGIGVITGIGFDR